MTTHLKQGDEITVDLYRSLPAHGYKLIIFRAHSGLLSHREDSEIVVRRATAIFTNEPYSKCKHISEQLDGQLARARVAEGYPEVFAIGARFIKHSQDSWDRFEVAPRSPMATLVPNPRAMSFPLESVTTISETPKLLPRCKTVDSA